MAISCSCRIIDIDEFGAALMEWTPEEFSEKGFEFGDTVDLAFSNGFFLSSRVTRTIITASLHG